MNRVLELYGYPACYSQDSWPRITSEQHCPYIMRRCLKTRKSNPAVTIGACSVEYGRDHKQIVICPYRLLEGQRIFFDSLHLLTLHEPGNDLHVVPEVSIPGGSVDYFLVSAREGKVKDFVGIEIQTLDTTGTVWPARQKFLQEVGIDIKDEAIDSDKTFGMNWKMSAKTILMQLHHKIETFEYVSKHLILVVQDHFLDYIKREFQMAHVNTQARIGDVMQIHSYVMEPNNCGYSLRLTERMSTDSEGIARILDLQATPKVEIEELISNIESKISINNRLALS